LCQPNFKSAWLEADPHHTIASAICTMLELQGTLTMELAILYPMLHQVYMCNSERLETSSVMWLCFKTSWLLVFKGLVQFGFLTSKRGNCGLQLVQTDTQSRWTATELIRTGPNWFSCPKKTSPNWFYPKK
jgi:hypothetical protein